MATPQLPWRVRIVSPRASFEKEYPSRAEAARAIPRNGKLYVEREPLGAKRLYVVRVSS
jgi:hypothetical protein